jgi:4-hydroxybenzoate polyprenyltransferase
MVKRYESIINQFVFSNIFISACAAALTAETFALLKLSYAYWFIGIIFCSTLLVYNLHYLLKSKSEKADSRLNWMRNNNAMVIAISICSLLTLIALVILHYRYFFIKENTLSSIKLLLFVAIPFFALAYSHPILPGRRNRVRTWGWFKPVYLSLFWSAITSILPLYFLLPEIVFNQTSAVSILILQRFAFMLGLCILFNIKDLEEDEKDGLKTLAVVYGKQSILYYGKWMLLFFNSICTWLLVWQLGYTNIMIVTAFFIPVLLVWLLFHYFHRSTNTAAFVLINDGMMVIKAVLLIFALYIFS